jgi:probable rRNA maturation factor
MSPPEDSSLTFRRVPADVRPRALLLYARKLQRQVAGGKPFHCLLAGDAELRRLNTRFRGRDDSTDVLAFPGGGRGPLGDIAISMPRARSQARGFGHSTETEIRVLMLHGLLHLLGFDHETDGGAMARAETRWRARLGLPGGLIERVTA